MRFFQPNHASPSVSPALALSPSPPPSVSSSPALSPCNCRSRRTFLSDMGLGLGMRIDNWNAMVERWRSQTGQA